jgi:hypothetical protein
MNPAPIVKKPEPENAHPPDSSACTAEVIEQAPAKNTIPIELRVNIEFLYSVSMIQFLEIFPYTRRLSPTRVEENTAPRR